MATELTIKIKNSAQTYSHKFLEHGEIILGKDDPRITALVQKALSHLKIDEECSVEDLKIDVKVKQVIQ